MFGNHTWAYSDDRKPPWRVFKRSEFDKRRKNLADYPFQSGRFRLEKKLTYLDDDNRERLPRRNRDRSGMNWRRLRWIGPTPQRRRFVPAKSIRLSILRNIEPNLIIVNDSGKTPVNGIQAWHRSLNHHHHTSILRFFRWISASDDYFKSIIIRWHNRVARSSKRAVTLGNKCSLRVT